MRRIIKKYLSISLVFFLLIGMQNMVADASETSYNYDVQHDNIMSLDGVSFTFEGNLVKNDDGDFGGTLRSGFTEITCVLSGNTGGIDCLYEVYIRWNGSNAIQAIAADNLLIKNASVLSGDSPYFDKSFYISGLSATSGFRPIGTCYIDKSVSSVKVKSTGLKVALYNQDESVWWSNGEMNGNIRLK